MKCIWRLLVAATLASPALAAHASRDGPLAEVVSVSRRQPEPASMARYLHGHLGVLWPSYERPFLMMAYRQAMGHPATTGADADAWTRPRRETAPGEDWLAARRAAGGAANGGSQAAGERATSLFSYAGNCQPDAFRLAAATLRARVKAHANQPTAIADWIAGQDAVFAACDRNDAPAPQAAPLSAPAWLRHDRAYQQAASLLYLGKGKEAAQAFSAIAAQAGSPWSEWAEYLQARLWWRDTFKEPSDYKSFATQAKDWRREPMPARLAALSGQARDPEVREAAAALLRTVQARIEPVDVHRALWRQIDAAEPPADLDAWMADERFLWVLMKDEDLVDDWLFQTRSINTKIPTSPQGVDLSAAWAKHPTPAWLASALLAARPGAGGMEPVLAASRTLEPGDPLYFHCAWQRARLSLEGRDFDGARMELAAARVHLEGEGLGTRQAFEQLEMLSASSLSALAQHLQRLPLGSEIDYDGRISMEPLAAGTQRTPFIDADTRLWLATHIDGQEMLELARERNLAKGVREALAGGAWLRGALLGQEELAADAVKVLSSIGAVADASAAATPLEQRFRMARHLLLHDLNFIGPQTQAAGITDRWWRTAPAFHDTDKIGRIAKMGSALSTVNQTTWLGEAMLPWLRTHKSAEGPALLVKLVYASRHGEPDTATSRAAFQLLHQQYPNSPEAQRTRYYF